MNSALGVRAVAIVVGLGAIAAVTHGTVMATGGYGFETNAPMLIALASVQAVLALTVGDCFAKGRYALGVLAILVLVACEVCSFVATANLQLTSLDSNAAPVLEAEAKYKAATARVEAAERSDIVVRAEQAKARVGADAMAKSAEKGCATNCRQILEAQVAAAAATVEAARSSFTRELAESRAALASTPLPGSATPLADRTGISAKTLDLLYVGFRGFAVAAGAAVLLAYGAHGQSRTRENATLEVIHPALARSQSKKQIALARAPAQEADRFARAVFLPAADGRVALRDVRAAYHKWCAASDSTPLPDKAIGKALNELFAGVGLPIDGDGADAAIVGISWRDMKQLEKG
jgi:hypothetical protein